MERPGNLVTKEGKPTGDPDSFVDQALRKEWKTLSPDKNLNREKHIRLLGIWSEQFA